MSHPAPRYPPPAYLGEGGRASATIRAAAQEPDLRFPSGGSVHYLATSASTGGRFGLYRWNMTGEAGGADPHFHRTISESFFVLTGTVRLYDGRAWSDATAGDYLFVPEGGIHGFRNDSGAPASMLILFAPGADREAYFETLAGVAGDLPRSDEDWTAFFLRHDNHWVEERGR